MAILKTTYKDDILNSSVNAQRKYNMIHNSDGTVSFEDVTNYSQVGDTFGAGDINLTNAEVNNRLVRTALGSSADLGVMPYYTFKKLWSDVPTGFSGGVLGYGMGYYIGHKDNESNGFFLIQATNNANDDALRVSGGAYLVTITAGTWKLEQVDRTSILSEWTD